MTTKEERRDALKEKRNAQRASKQLKRKEEKKDFKKSLVKRIEETFLDKGMNRTKLATAMNVTPQQVSKWLSLSKKEESQLPDIINLKQIAKALDVSLDYLCGCEEKEDEKKDTSINSFDDLLLSIWNQYEYCLDNAIGCRLASVSYYHQWVDNNKYHIQFIGMDMNDRFIYDFLEVFKAITDLQEKGKLSFEQTKSIILNQVKEVCNERNAYHDRHVYDVQYPIDDHGVESWEKGFAVPLDLDNERRYKD